MSTPSLRGSRFSPQQKRLFLLQGVEGALGAQGALLLTGQLEVDRLCAAAKRLATRHEILCTTFRKRPGMRVPLQVAGGVDPAWESVERPESTLEELLEREAETPFDLEEGPILRFTLVRQSSERHLLLFTLPALCGDPASLETIADELATLYAGDDGEELPEDPLQYADYAEWSLQMLLEEDEEKVQGVAFWSSLDLSQLEDSSWPGAFRPEAFRPRRLQVPLADGLAQRCRAVAEAAGGTLADALVVAYEVLLYKLTGRRETVVGRLSDGRGYPDFEGAVGLYARYLPLAGRLSGKPSFSELIRRQNELFDQACEWEEYLSTAGSGEFAAPCPWLFEHAVEPESRAVAGVEFMLLSRSSDLEPFVWRLSASERGGELDLVLNYDAGRFEAAEAESAAARLGRILERLVVDPERPIGEFDALSGAERDEWTAFNSTARATAETATFLDDWAWVASRRAAHPAVVCEDRSLNYGELESRSNRLAHHLRELGVGPEGRVGLCLERSLDSLVGILGILKAGGAFVPLDASLPTPRLRSMCATAGLQAVVSQEDWLAALSFVDEPKVALDRDGSILARYSDTVPEVAITPRNLAYVIFTSGTTGQPKGVAVEHRQLHNYIRGIVEVLAPSGGESWALVSTFNADLGHTAIFPSLATGGVLHVIEAERSADPEGLSEYFSRHPVDLMKIVPSHLGALLLAASPERILPRQTLILGGEEANPRLLERLDAIEEGPAILNHYGPTETTVGILTHRLELPAQSAPVGRPLANAKAHLVDADGQRVPPGVLGEILLGGDNVSRGYLGAPARTAERFVPDPFGPQPGGRLYRSGDLGRLVSPGVIEFAGRRDHQVKVRGFRIELAEVEGALLEHPAVREAVVVAREDKNGNPRLVAYTVTRPGSSADGGALREFVRQSLPEPLTPAVFVSLKRLPLTPNGKLDRHALPAPEEARETGTRSFVAPRTPVEEILAACWREVLGVERIGVNDNFFELGGDSILVIQVVARANRHDLRLKPRQFFDHQSLGELAAVAEAGSRLQAEQDEVTGDMAPTPIQRWFFAQDFPSPEHWNQVALLEVDQSLSASQLSAALLALLRHHDALRLRFVRDDGAWRAFHDAVPESAPLDWLDFSTLDCAAQRERIESEAAAAQRRLDLAAGPVFKGVYFALGEGSRDRLLLIGHHLVVDGVSWRILLEDLERACRQASAGEQIELPPKTTSFKEWSERLIEYAAAGLAEREGAFWSATDQLGGPFVAGSNGGLSADHPAGENVLESRDEIRVSLSLETTQQLLQEAPAAYRTRIDDLLLTALVWAWGEQTGRRAVRVEFEGHGREDLFDDVDLSRTVGWLTIHYPVLLDLGPADDYDVAIKRVKEQLRDVPAGGIGYGLLRHLGPEETLAERLGSMPEPDVGFNYLGQMDGPVNESSLFRAASESPGPTKHPRSRVRRELEVVALVRDGRFEASWRFSREIFERATIERLAAVFIDALSALIAHCVSGNSGGLTPSDFGLAKLDQSQLDKIVQQMGRKAKQP